MEVRSKIFCLFFYSESLKASQQTCAHCISRRGDLVMHLEMYIVNRQTSEKTDDRRKSIHMYASILVVAAEPFVLYRESGCPNYIELGQFG